MKKFLNDYFTFNKRERTGIFFLCLLLIIQLFYLKTLHYWFPQKGPDLAPFENEIAIFLEEQEKLKNAPKAKRISGNNANNTDRKTIQAELFPFDPNNLPEADWQRLGLSPKQIRSIKKYESSGGKFFKKEDLKKMYAIPEGLYAVLEPYITIPARKENNYKEELLQLSSIELNTADSVELMKLKGIGPAYAGRIIRYRDLLGGYVSVGQLKDVRNMSEELYNSIVPFLSVDDKLVNKININQCERKNLQQHPYITWNVANSIISYREKHGLYKTVEDIQKSDLVNEELYLKLAAYLTVE